MASSEPFAMHHLPSFLQCRRTVSSHWLGHNLQTVPALDFFRTAEQIRLLRKKVPFESPSVARRPPPLGASRRPPPRTPTRTLGSLLYVLSRRRYGPNRVGVKSVDRHVAVKKWTCAHASVPPSVACVSQGPLGYLGWAPGHETARFCWWVRGLWTSSSFQGEPYLPDGPTPLLPQLLVVQLAGPSMPGR